MEEDEEAVDEEINLEDKFKLIERDMFTDKFFQETLLISNKFINAHRSDQSPSLSYTEVSFFSFLSLILSLKGMNIGFEENATFVDVGCGPGKTLVVVSLMNIFKRAVGIDIMEGMLKKAQDTINYFTRKFRSPVDLTEIEVLLGDGTHYNWSFANLVFIQATCFNEAMMLRINNIANKMRVGTVLILVTNR
jgi:SAM-dependent methyltransferase